VRGYRENVLVRDQGLVGSIEARVPIWTHGRFRLEAATFFDAAYSWNKGRPNGARKDLMSLGVGARGSFGRFVGFELYWAESLKGLDLVQEWDLQDTGLHFRLTLRYP
jgi:hemolysin activation/secretion protein